MPPTRKPSTRKRSTRKTSARKTSARKPQTFDSLEHTPANHYRLRFFETIIRLRAALPNVEEELPFLVGYYEEIDAGAVRTAAAFARARRAWERRGRGKLPILDLAKHAGLDDHSLALLFAAGLIEEDHRFAALFEVLQGVGQQRPTLGLLNTWFAEGDARQAIPHLEALGLVQIANPADPRMTWSIGMPGPISDALRGTEIATSDERLRTTALGDRVGLDELILPGEAADKARAAVPLLGAGRLASVTIRGPRSSGRRTLAAGIAAELGLGAIELASPEPDDPLLRSLPAMAVLRAALPVIALDPGPTEVVVLPGVVGSLGPVAVTLGQQGGVTGPCVERGVSITLGVPEPDLRARHWASAVQKSSTDEATEHVVRRRMTGGNIRRTAHLATAEAALAGRGKIAPADVRRAARALGGQQFDSLAHRVVTVEDWSQVVLGEETMRELVQLEQRCRQRERLGGAVGDALRADLGAGVRALLSGPSGTGKTLAARALAGILDTDLYRIDLAMVVDKYIGETEKNLNRIFSRAEEADVALLLDEGDALLTRRTTVETSNDRYANLETNYLLQRLESFEGILIITTNASERIDAAFQRRMDVTIDFYPPDPFERWTIWSLHLPAEHQVTTACLEEVSHRCDLTGAQIRNAVLHAALLALDRDAEIDDGDLMAAVEREYRKSGEVSPLPEVVHG